MADSCTRLMAAAAIGYATMPRDCPCRSGEICHASSSAGQMLKVPNSFREQFGDVVVEE